MLTRGQPTVPNSSRDLSEGIESIRFAANGLEVHALAAGPVDGPLVMLLHGFLELSFMAASTGGAEQRRISRGAPDQRGYGQFGRGPYDIKP